MEVRAFEALEALLFLAGLRFVHERVELLLLPAVAELALLESLAAFFVARDESARLPVLTELRFVPEEVWFTPEVLEVMCVNALCLVMLVVEGTPLGLEEEHVELVVLVARQQMVDQSHFDVLHRVRKGTIVSVLALLDLAWEAVAELRFVFVFVVEALHSVMCSAAFVLLRAPLCVSELAKLWSV